MKKRLAVLLLSAGLISLSAAALALEEKPKAQTPRSTGGTCDKKVNTALGLFEEALG
jgi:hypothetical protein